MNTSVRGIACLLVLGVALVFASALSAQATDPTVTLVGYSGTVIDQKVRLDWWGYTLWGSYTPDDKPEWRPVGGSWSEYATVWKTFLHGRTDWQGRTTPADQTPSGWEVRGKATFGQSGVAYSETRYIDNPLN